MKSENRICFLYALLCSFPFLIIILFLLLFSRPVHAAEVNSFVLNTFKGDYTYSYSNTNTESNNYRECFTGYLHFTDKKFYAFVYDTETSSFGMFRLFYYDSGSGKVKVYQNSTKSTYNFPSGFKDESAYFNIYYVDQESNKRWMHGEYCAFFVQSYNTDPEFSSDLMIFNSESSMLLYCQSGDTSGIINGGSDIDPHDDAYAFTGFSMSGKTATWTGTTERSYLLDMDVNEWVNYTYGFATSEDQEVSAFIDAEAHYPTSDKKLALPWDEMEANKKEGEFIRQVNIIPCYGTSGAGFYFGVPCKVYFNQDGSIDKIVRDFPQSSGDFSYKHIFSSDKYSIEIPAPELSAISHNGFTLLNNSNNDYYVDIILESNLYGVKMEKDAGTWLPVVDTDWVYNSHYYNFADTSQIAINNDVIYIPNLFSVDPESDLVNDFKEWSAEYSTYSSLPSMSFLKRSTAARTKYVDQFLYKDDSKYTDSEQLRYSHMAESVFYVRYYNKSMVYGPWVRYKFRDGYEAEVIDGTLGGAYIDVGQVDVDDDGNVRVDEKGNPIVSDNVSGRQNYDTGESDFSDGSFSLDLSDVTKFFDYLKKIFESVTGALSSFGSVVASCFGFLPGELVNALIFGICVMMFIGIIKAVKG